MLLLIVFLVAGLILYFALGWVMNDNFDEILEHRSERLKTSLLINSGIDSILESPDQSIVIVPVASFYTHKTFSDTVLVDTVENENISYRKMTFGLNSQGKFYKIEIMVSKLETEDLVELIFYFMLGFFTFIVLLLFFLNHWLSSSVWHPFYKILDQLRTFKIGQKDVVNFAVSNVSEFRELSKTLTNMVLKAQSDFNSLKEFTENASHEIQTPLAIIKTNLESVLQDQTISDQRYHQIQSAYESVTRLSKLNQALLLLSKIENHQFIEEEEIDLCNLIRHCLVAIEELIEFKKIEVVQNLHQPVKEKLNLYLAEILINNLLSNAVKHNVEGGQIKITSSHHQLIFSSTGKPLTIPAEKLFQRFVKQNAGNESTGLGLAIVSEICKNYSVNLQYGYQDGFHNFTLLLNSEISANSG